MGATQPYFLFQPDVFYRPIVDLLLAEGHRPNLICAGGHALPVFEGIEGDPALVLRTEAVTTDWTARYGIRPVPPSRELLDALAPHESTTLQMLDRHGQVRIPVVELRERYLDVVGAWSGAIAQLQPAAVVFAQVPHVGWDYILYALAEHLGITTVMVDRTNLRHRMFLRRNPSDVPIPGIGAHPAPRSDGPVDFLTYTELNERNARLNDVDDIQRVLGPGATARRLADKVDRRGKTLRSHRLHTWDQQPVRELTVTMRAELGIARSRRAFRRYSALATTSIPAADFVYFPLHLQPERSTLPTGGSLSDQLHLVRMLAAALPDGWKLVVKEHPRQFRSSTLSNHSRTPGFYEHLAQTPNVLLADIGTSSAELIDRARAVATVTGSAGWEAVQAGTPVLAFGYAWYLHAPGAHAVGSVDDCRRALATVEAGPPIARDDVEAYVEVVKAHTFHARFVDTELDLGDTALIDENARSYAAAFLDVLRGD